MSKYLQDMLDSDDELPSDYEEQPIMPAYLDDSRFNYIEEIKQSSPECVIENTDVPPANKPNNASPVIIPTRRKVIDKGLLNAKDLLCFQSIKSSSNDTVTWFFRFLILKDLQDNYKFLKTCLVPNYENCYSVYNSDIKYNSNLRPLKISVKK